MINFDSLTLKLFLDENKNFFTGARIQKVQQPNRHELIFHMRNAGVSKKFYINFNPNFYHLCFINEQSEIKREIKIPKSAPMFCMLLRKYIQNAKILRVEVPKYERIFEIYFEYFDELNEKTILCLAIELMGKHSNVILYNYDTNVIIGCAHNVSSDKSRERELYGSLPYIYPPKKKRKNINLVSFESFCSEVNQDTIQADIVQKYNFLQHTSEK
ncbi:NFACT family protein [bacterium]|nr:NFACT family protein [bacterium]